MKLYSTGCPKCNILKLKLDAADIAYEEITDLDEINKVATEHSIKSAPFVEYAGVFYTFEEFVKKIPEIQLELSDVEDCATCKLN